MKRHIAYIPSKGVGYAQSLIPRSLPLAILAAENFAKKYFPSVLTKPVELDVWYAPGFDNNVIPQHIVERALKIFGEPRKKDDFTWENAEYEKAKEFLLSGHPWPASQGLGPVSLTYGATFRMLNQEYPDIEESLVMFQLQKSSKIGLQLSLPIYTDNPDFEQKFLEISNIIPAKLSLKYFRVVEPKKDGKEYKYRKPNEQELFKIKCAIEKFT